MSVEEMYEDFRSQYPEWTKSADARHIEILGAGEAEGAFLWFESLASALNAQICLLYTSPSPRDLSTSRMPSSA